MVRLSWTEEVENRYSTVGQSVNKPLIILGRGQCTKNVHTPCSAMQVETMATQRQRHFYCIDPEIRQALAFADAGVGAVERVQVSKKEGEEKYYFYFVQKLATKPTFSVEWVLQGIHNV